MITATANGKVDNILTALENCTEKDLASIQEEIKRLTTRLQSLRKVEALVELKLGKEPSRRQPGRKKVGTIPKLPVAMEEIRRKIVKYLAKGAKPVADLADRFDIPEDRLEEILDYGWFAKSSTGYHITPQGRSDVL